MSFFSRVFKSKGAAAKKGAALDIEGAAEKPKPRWEDAWSRTELDSEEVRELIHECTQEMKSRALDTPFVLLPFRPDSDTMSAKSLVRNFFKAQYEESGLYTGKHLQQELRLTEPIVLCSVLKWCWSRLAGGIVTWDAYELFKIGESDSNMARNAFDTFIPLSVDSEARKQIIFDFFDLLAAIAARSKMNGLGGRKLSRMAGWWAFEHVDQGLGFDGGYKSWASAADACSHLFFAYLRSLSPESVTGISGISALPRSLQALLSQTEYPPQTPTLLQSTTSKVVMIVDSVSPTPFALLRRAKNFEYRDDDEALQTFSSYDDPVKALTDECCRVLNAISHTNESKSTVGKVASDSNCDPSWSRFEDLGFNTLTSNGGTNGAGDLAGFSGGLRGDAHSHTTAFGRPTTPSWADFLSTGFMDDKKPGASPLLLPPDKVLPPIGAGAPPPRGHSSQSHVRNIHPSGGDLEPGELASITQFELDDTFWWVWITSLAGEELAQRKAVFGRCALVETEIPGARWLLIEEQVKGASPGQEEGAYIAEKKSRFSFSRRGRLGRKKSAKVPATVKEPYNRAATSTPMKSSIGPDQQAKIQAAAAALAKKEQDRKDAKATERRSRTEDDASQKTNSVLTLQPVILSEAAPAMKWAKEFDRDAIRAAYLSDPTAGRGSRENLALPTSPSNGALAPGLLPRNLSNRELPATPKEPEPVRAPSPLPARPATPPQDTVMRNTSIQDDAAATFLPPKKETEETDAAEAERKVSFAQGSSSPESTKAKKDQKKLQKANTGGGGFKRIFSRRKNERDEAVSPTPEDDQPAPAESIRDRISSPVIEYDDEDAESKVTKLNEDLYAAPEPSTHPAHTYVDSTPQAGPAPVSQQQQRPPVPSPRVTAREQRDADAEFSRFDQGPLQDIPAFVPDDVSEPEAPVRAPSPTPPAPVQRREPSPPPPRKVSPVRAEPKRETPAPAVRAPPRATPEPEAKSEPKPLPTPTPAAAPGGAVAVARAKLQARQAQAAPTSGAPADVRPMAVGDRWAQIRKNAQERAARMSEEQGGSPKASPVTTTRGSPVATRERSSTADEKSGDDGDTSGEETIESRVARIKARVAELTGNMDASGNITTGPAPR